MRSWPEIYYLLIQRVVYFMTLQERTPVALYLLSRAQSTREVIKKTSEGSEKADGKMDDPSWACLGQTYKHCEDYHTYPSRVCIYTLNTHTQTAHTNTRGHIRVQTFTYLANLSCILLVLPTPCAPRASAIKTFIFSLSIAAHKVKQLSSRGKVVGYPDNGSQILAALLFFIEN